MNTAERWNRIQRLFIQALEVTGPERNQFLSDACADDAALREQLDSLLQYSTEEATDLRHIVDNAHKQLELSTITLGQHLGPYRLEEILGEGGMGTVFRAVRDDHQYQQQVAIKRMHTALYSEQARARFLTERQILAQLEHPYIARLLDGGASGDGLPYLVMEYIDGEPLDRYCDQHQLNIEQRLRLFLKVCEAVQYAHRNLIVHRDLKPGNILVTEDGTPRLLDFGIAKLLESQPGEGPLTQLTCAPMTPDYASPEQIFGETITTASDIYALGILLFELLTGVRPYQLKGTPVSAWRQILVDTESVRPSIALDRIADRPTAANLQRLRRQLQGDLDNIVVTALAKDASRRYPSVDRLAEDLHAYLHGQPVSARPATAKYLLGKFILRHAWAVGVGITTVLVITALALMTTMQSFRLRDERNAAQQAQLEAEIQSNLAAREATKYRSVSDFVGSMLSAADPSQAKGREITVREILDDAQQRLSAHSDSTLDPEVEAVLRKTLGTTYGALGDYKSARTHLTKAASLCRQDNDRAGGCLIETLQALSMIHQRLGDYPAAETTLREALDRVQQDSPNAALWQARLQGRLAGLYSEQRRDDEAATTYESALARLDDSSEADPELYLDLLNGLGVENQRRERFHEAASLFEKVLAKRLERFGEDHPQTLDTLRNLGITYRHVQRTAESEKMLQQALSVSRHIRGASHPETLKILNNLGGVYWEQGKLKEAEPLLQAAYTGMKDQLGEDHPQSIRGLHNLAVLYEEQGRYELSAQFHQQSLKLAYRIWGEDHPNTDFMRVNYAMLEEQRGNAAAAEALYRQVFETKDADSDDPLVLRARSYLGQHYQDLGRYADAVRELKHVYRIQSKVLGDEATDTLETKASLQEVQDALAKAAMKH